MSPPICRACACRGILQPTVLCVWCTILIETWWNTDATRKRYVHLTPSEESVAIDAWLEAGQPLRLAPFPVDLKIKKGNWA